ncbi:MAG: signal peptidase I [Candidatus Abyssobacteria bacterium SURF_17]|uniref:Signal peptidase I n=1 Tax=Candidatus Abyssobacteria bacterium SURF_17 TaxID=2093361 RepID=A0A419ETA2_9BACT|nr:MAG: signal peptidase I [Candidatus Abyssubacteria bacterium SURF_17]
MKKSRRSPWLVLAFLIAVIVLFDVKGIKFYLVPSDSMKPTLERSDYIIGFEIASAELERGDVVVFTSGYKGDYYVKRVVGLPGETLVILAGSVYISGRLLEEPYVHYHSAENLGPIHIPDGRVFLMGDNRPNSFDSRWFGPVPMRLIESRVSFIYNPISRMGRVH